MADKTTDTIPRASVDQLFAGLGLLQAHGGRATFEDVRLSLLGTSRRRVPNTATAMWTVARDVLTELEKLNFARVGILPRKLSDVKRLRDAPCELLPNGAELLQIHATNLGQAYDRMLMCWLERHLYFRALIVRVLKSPLYVPDVTSLAQLGHEDVKARHASAILKNVQNDCGARLDRVGWSTEQLSRFRGATERRTKVLHDVFLVGELDAKRIVDSVQDGIVMPAFLETEELPFDPVTFQQLLRTSQEFLVAAWSASHPGFNGRIVYPVCSFHPPLEEDSDLAGVVVAHHGLSYAEPLFSEALRDAYTAAAVGSSGLGYVSAYTVRALVCLALKIPPTVFAKSLERLISTGSRADLAIYTELPFEPPPQGEDYVVISNRRIGRLKLVSMVETKSGDQIIS